jgi:hypothetical protein
MRVWRKIGLMKMEFLRLLHKGDNQAGSKPAAEGDRAMFSTEAGGRQRCRLEAGKKI